MKNMRGALVLMLLASACGSSLGATGSSASTQPSPTAKGCEPTSYRDASGVVTANGTIGILGNAWISADAAMNDYLVIVRRGGRGDDKMALRFNSVGNTAPATFVTYGVGARAQPNPWGAFVFQAGWKPIGFARSCWRVIADGQDTGLVLFVRP